VIEEFDFKRIKIKYTKNYNAIKCNLSFFFFGFISFTGVGADLLQVQPAGFTQRY